MFVGRPHRWLYLILLLAFVLRTYHIGYPAWDYHNWRQSITLMVARDFARHDFRLFHPQVAWVGSGGPSAPSYFSGEFSIQSIVAAILYRSFGESDSTARLVVVAFSLLGIFFLYDFLQRSAGALSASLGALVYSLLPYHLFFGRVFMPDVPALSLGLGAITWLDRWTTDRRWVTLLVAASLGALAVLQKLTVAFIGLPLLYLFWLAYGKRLFVQREPYVFAAIVALPSLAWYTHSAALAKESGFAIMQPFLFAKNIGLWMQPAFQKDIWNALMSEALSPLGLGFAVLGLLWPAVKGRAAGVFRLWVVGGALLLFLYPDVLPANHYYLCILLPGCGALAGLALTECVADRKFYVPVVLAVVFFTAGAIRAALPLYVADRWPYNVGVLLNRLTNPEDLIVTETGGNPNVLYYADRRGWMRDRNYDPAFIDQALQRGARYYADVFVSDPDEHAEFFRGLDNKFRRLTPAGRSWPWPIYQLVPPPGLVDEHLLLDSGRARFGDQIELRGFAIREILSWPASFEILYQWRCLKQDAADLRVVVHLKNSAGQIAYQLDHRPRCPTSKWKEGDVVRERSVLVLPETTPEGKYELLLGSHDSFTQDGRVKVAAVTVKAPPKYRWLWPE